MGEASTDGNTLGGISYLNLSTFIPTALRVTVTTKLPTMTNHQVQGITPQAWAQQKGSDSVKAST